MGPAAAPRPLAATDKSLKCSHAILVLERFIFEHIGKFNICEIGTGDGGGSNNLPILPIQATKPVDKELINPTDNF